MSQPSCATCRHGELTLAPASFQDDPVPVIYCRRFPPQLVAVDGQVAQTWPTMQADDACGEWATDGASEFEEFFADQAGSGTR